MKKTYFASDFHLGIDARLTSRDRERQIVRWLDWASRDAEAIYLVGDVFDYFFEYNTVVTKGFHRLLGKLAELRDGGLPIFFLTGNHDMWVFKFFEDDFGIPIYRQPIVRDIGGKRFFIGHGDGLGPADYGYKFIKRVFANPINQWLFARLHPNLGIGAMHFFSGKSRQAQAPSVKTTFLGEPNEWLLTFSNETLLTQPDIDFFIFGHRHLPIDWLLKNGKSRYINLGEWLNFNTFATFDGTQLSLQVFENQSVKIFTNHEQVSYEL